MYFSQGVPKRWTQIPCILMPSSSFDSSLALEFFTLCFILRNLLIALVPLLPDPIVQVLLTELILLVWLLSTAVFFPWRNDKANYLDLVVTTNTILIMGTSG